MNKVTTGIFGAMGLLVVGGAFLNSLTDGLTEPIAGLDVATLVLLTVAVMIVWLFYIGTQVSGKGGL